MSKTVTHSRQRGLLSEADFMLEESRSGNFEAVLLRLRGIGRMRCNIAYLGTQLPR